MKKKSASPEAWVSLGIVIAIAVAGSLFVADKVTVLTPDQKAFALFKQGAFEAAAVRFADPMWNGVALFRQGEFEQAAGMFAGMDTAAAAFNQGNSLLMMGQYEVAAARYSRALELRPEWDDASINRDIALARAALLKREGGDMTGGMLGADDIVFTTGQTSPGAGEEQTDGGDARSDEELRAIWLRQVQTKPADFLAAKFAYQHAMRLVTESEQGAAQ